MYRKSRHDDELPEIGLYFEGRLNPENRWVKLAERLPWQELETDYAKAKSHAAPAYQIANLSPEVS